MYRWMIAALLATAAAGAVAVARLDGEGGGTSASRAGCVARVTELSFVSHRAAGGLGQIFKLDVAHPSRVTRLTRSDAWATSPTWSPDGARFAYAQLTPGAPESEVYVADADGRNAVRVLGAAAAPAWSPDGSRIAVAKLEPRGIGILDVEKAIAGDASAYEQVTSVGGETPEEYATWSPDGKRLAFTSHRAGSSDIWVVDVAGENLRNLTNDPTALDDSPSWSPDGKTIAFGSSRDSTSQSEDDVTGDIYLMRPDGSNVRRLTDAPGGSYGPVWSPDGRLIAFNSQRDGNSELYVMRADGTRQRRLTRHPEPDGFPAWVGRGCSSGPR